MARAENSSQTLPLSAPLSKSLSEPLSELLSEPLAEPLSMPVPKLLSEPFSKHLTKPLSKPVSEPQLSSATQHELTQRFFARNEWGVPMSPPLTSTTTSGTHCLYEQRRVPRFVLDALPMCSSSCEYV